jgi:hypothetical protein
VLVGRFLSAGNAFIFKHDGEDVDGSAILKISYRITTITGLMYSTSGGFLLFWVPAFGDIDESHVIYKKIKPISV